MIKNYDLEPQKDPKGGSPKTPSGGIKKSSFQTPTPYPPYMAEPPKHHWYSGVQFRDVLYAISLIVVALLFFLQRIFDVHDLTFKMSATEKIQEQISETIKSQQKLIDANSVNIQLQSARNLEQDREINQSREQLLTLVPDVREVKTKLNFIANLLDPKSKEKP